MSWSRTEFLKVVGMGGLSSLLPEAFHSFLSQKPVIKPRRLKEGDTIGMVSPGSILPNLTDYDRIISEIRSLGFGVKEGAHARESYGNLAGRDEQRAKDLNRMFADSGVDAIIPFRGGWGSNRILQLLDFELIRNNPKPLIGFSDITSLLLAIYAKTGLVTFHGPVGKSEWTSFTKKHFRHMLMEQGTRLIKPPVDAGFKRLTLSGGMVKGKLLGGNLTVITSMIGSNYLPDWDGAILFIEDIGEEPYRVDRMLTQLKLNGILRKLNGFIFSRCTECKSTSSRSLTLEQIMRDHIELLEIPSFYGSMIGHLERMYTLPIGVEAEMDADTGTIKVLESPTTTL